MTAGEVAFLASGEEPDMAGVQSAMFTLVGNFAAGLLGGESLLLT